MCCLRVCSTCTVSCVWRCARQQHVCCGSLPTGPWVGDDCLLDDQSGLQLHSRPAFTEWNIEARKLNSIDEAGWIDGGGGVV